jgi:hypothetical protein
MTAIDDREQQWQGRLGDALTEELPDPTYGGTYRVYFNAVLHDIPNCGVFTFAEASVADVLAAPLPPPPSARGDPYEFWSAEEIRSACNDQVPLENIRLHWPGIAGSLHDYDQWSRPSAAGVVATTAIETAHTFEPVREAFWCSEAWRAANLRYHPYYGRGYIQLTWEANYRTYGNLIGVGDQLVNVPDKALEAGIAAEVFACYWQQRGIKPMCEAGDWAAARKAVQGGSAGLVEFTAICERLAW